MDASADPRRHGRDRAHRRRRSVEPRSCSGTWTTCAASGTRSITAAEGRPAPFLIYQEGDAVTRALRDYLSDDIGEILIDEPGAYQKAQEYMQRFMPPEYLRKLKLYEDEVPLFTRFQIESQIESAYSHKVTLPSGGSIVIDHDRGAGVDRHQLGSRDARRRHRNHSAATPTSKPPTKSRVSCGCATSAA